MCHRSQQHEKDRVAEQVLRAFSSHGLFYAVGHGFTAASQAAAFDDARSFFDLPEEEKLACNSKPGFSRGYVGVGVESGTDLLEYKEAFSFGYPWQEGRATEHSLQGPNVWPPEAALGAPWRARMLSTFATTVKLVEAAGRAASLALGWDELRLARLCEGADTIAFVRAFHYLATDATGPSGGSGGDNGGGGDSGGGGGSGSSGGGSSSSSGGGSGGASVTGSSPHTDWGLMTAIVQDGAGGLQFWESGGMPREGCCSNAQRAAADALTARCGGNGGGGDGDACAAQGGVAAEDCCDELEGAGGGAWVDVPPRDDGSIVILCGDFLRLLSGMRLASPLHRVVSGPERLSYVLFYYPAFETRLRDVGAGSCQSRAQAYVGRQTKVASVVAPKGVEYNTLLDTVSLEELQDMPFGEYIEAKWKGVTK